ncbi:hypothetical protein SAMN04489844_0806 [Nocardioides exalbidus]|uniref:Uncharacterized protein n=1 Tax=Nocardioides exalbidus TaxID=402596 RepID=A0A1H4L9X2_9ACTN|nr:hypothetical protein [Nocardioides exalbidus]SEB66972.1 hypothetical protein SAMN04489844_0806 [Nocardioides exalbidus]
MKYGIANLNEARPSRRAVVRTAAWSVPVISVAATAPAFAASPCDARTDQALSWNGGNVTFTRTSDTVASATLVPATNVPALTLDVKASYTGLMKAGYENPGTNTVNPSLRRSANVGNLNKSGISLWQATTRDTPSPTQDTGTYVFTFSRPVTNLRFTITDIDSATGDFRDALTLTSGYTASYPATITKTTAAGVGEYFIATGENTPTDNSTGNAGNLTITYPGTISSFTIQYSNSASSFNNTLDQDQTIYVSDLTFNYKPC